MVGISPTVFSGVPYCIPIRSCWNTGIEAKADIAYRKAIQASAPKCLCFHTK